MDQNESSFDALFSCSEFKRYTSLKYQKAYDRSYEFLENNLSDRNTVHAFESEANMYSAAAEESGFEQGFCFAVKIVKFMLKI